MFFQAAALAGILEALHRTRHRRPALLARGPVHTKSTAKLSGGDGAGEEPHLLRQSVRHLWAERRTLRAPLHLSSLLRAPVAMPHGVACDLEQRDPRSTDPTQNLRRHRVNSFEASSTTSCAAAWATTSASPRSPTGYVQVVSIRPGEFVHVEMVPAGFRSKPSAGLRLTYANTPGHPRQITEAPVRLYAHGTTRKGAWVSAFSVDQKHCIAVTEEAVSLGDRLSVSLEN